LVGMFELKGAFGERVVGVLGGRAEVESVNCVLRTLAAVDKKTRTVSQVFDASGIAGVAHLVHAARFALTAQATRMNFASSLNIELICWVAGERQINRAFERVGLREGCKKVAILTIGETREQVKRAQAEIARELSIERNDKVLDVTREKTAALLQAFEIQKHELKIAGVEKLVLERVALLSLQR